MGDLMTVVDTTVVTVALPSIRNDLGFSQPALAWVVNAYTLSFGGFLLLAGRLGDMFGHRRLFLLGVGVFAAASLVCGVSTSRATLLAARAVQGLGGAVVSAAALSLIVVLFTEARERAKAMGVFGFVLSGGGVLGILAGGVLTDLLGWHWVFLINLPISLAVLILGVGLLPARPSQTRQPRLDAAGAVVITLALITAVDAIVTSSTAGWGSAKTLGLLTTAVVTAGVFVLWESRVANPLVPMSIFSHRNLSVANGVSVMWAAALFGLYFLVPLYLQLVLGYSPLIVGLAVFPGDLIMMLFSLYLSARLVIRLGFRTPLVLGLFIAALSLFWLARLPQDGSFLRDVLPAMILIGVGSGLSFNPLLMAATSDVDRQNAGLASGISNTAFLVGGALGIALLFSVAAARAHDLALAGHGSPSAMTGGYDLAFFVGAGFALAGAVGAMFLRSQREAFDTQPGSLVEGG